MHAFALTVHIATAGLLILLILLQSGKGASAGSAFSAKALQGALSGSRVSTTSLLVKCTVFLASVFFLTSLTLNYFSLQAKKSEQPVHNAQGKERK